MRSKEPRQGIPSTWFWWLLAVTFFFQTAVYAVRPMVSYRAISIGAGTFELGLITAAFAALSLILAVPLGRWIDRWGEPGFIVSGALLKIGRAHV